MNLIPFATIADDFNVIIFIPFGFLLPILIDKFESSLPIYSLHLGLVWRLKPIQLLYSALGRFDVDDLILNTLGHH
jgi:glycopeptide antibiotics resistance protein